MRLYLFNFILMLCSAAAVLVGGTMLARREIEERVPLDRTLVREFALELNGELSRLNNIYLNNLKQLTVLAVTAANATRREALKGSYSLLPGVCRYSFFYKKSDSAPEHITINSPPGVLLPEIIIQPPEYRFVFPNKVTLDRGQLFPMSGKPEHNEGWVSPRDKRFAVFWSSLDEGTALVFLLDRQAIGKIVCNYLKPKIALWYAPVRAGGGLHRLEGPGGIFLSGLEKTPKREPDFIIPMSALIGTWQILSWDTFKAQVVYDPARLAAAGTLSVILFAIGLVLFIQQRRALKTAQQRVSFVNRVSHELGTPLTNMLMNLELGIEALEEKPKEARNRLDLVLEETQRLARLVRNVLTFSRREHGKSKINPVPCVPDEVINDVLCQFEPALNRAGIEVERRLSASQTVICDIDALAQIVSNLVSNVEKYAATGKMLIIVSALDGKFLHIRVADRGPGIPPQARERIFHPFERVDDTVHNGVTGTGLGLAIARDLAQLMGGTLIILDAEHGAVFELNVPIKQT